MAFKLFIVVALLAVASDAGEVAVSYSTISNHVAHDYAAPTIAKIAVPAYHHSYAAAPAYHSAYALPALHAAPVVTKLAVAPVVHKVAVAAPVVHKYAAPVEYDHYAPANYQFEYAVHDPHTHDVKEQKEVRHGDAVHGVYSLIEPDGSKRVVEYTADKHNGFNAVVHRQHNAHPITVKAAPLAYYHH